MVLCSAHRICMMAAFAILIASPTLAQQADGSKSPSASDAYHSAMERANKEMMSMKMTGGPDNDFAMMMIPHHQAAIEMARIQMEKGTSSELKKMSGEAIKNQEKEITELKAWLAKNKK